jgi:hypothetical protein
MPYSFDACRITASGFGWNIPAICFPPHRLSVLQQEHPQSVQKVKTLLEKHTWCANQWHVSFKDVPIPQRRCCDKVSLSGVKKYYQRLEDERAGMEVGYESICNSFRRSIHAITAVMNLPHTQNCGYARSARTHAFRSFFLASNSSLLISPRAYRWRRISSAESERDNFP